MKNKYKTRKNNKQRGSGTTTGIKIQKNDVNGVNIPYIKKCPEGFVMCDQDEVNAGLCVPIGQETLCSDPNYTFRYVPPDETDRNGIFPKNRLNKEENAKGPIQEPSKIVKVFDIKYDGDEPDSENPENPKFILQTDVMMNEETGRLKSYAPEYHPTSCAIQQKDTATVEMTYNNGESYQRRVTDDSIILNNLPFSIPSGFKIVTQNALGLYRGNYREPSEPGSANEATFDIMELRTAILRDFLKKNSPDFICFQESTRTWIDLLDKQNVPEMYPYIYPTEQEMINLVENGANATVSMFSKYPATKATTYMLQGNSSYYNALGIYEFENLVIINVYMQAGSEISPGQKYKWENYARCRRQQLMFIKQKIDAIRSSGVSKEKAIIVLGDFNFELNSIRYRGDKDKNIEDKVIEDKDSIPERDENEHLIYDPTYSDMKWAEHKFLVGEKGLNLNDSYKELHADDPDKKIREGYTEFTDANTFRFLGKLEKKILRYDGIFFNDNLVPLTSEVINDESIILDDSLQTKELFVSNGITDYEQNIRKYNEEYNNHMIFNPKGNESAKRNKEHFLAEYQTRKGKNLSIENGFELFVSDHFGVMSSFNFKDGIKGGKRKRKRKITKCITRRCKRHNKKRVSKRRH
jgi:exonuclease III